MKTLPLTILSLFQVVAFTEAFDLHQRGQRLTTPRPELKKQEVPESSSPENSIGRLQEEIDLFQKNLFNGNDEDSSNHHDVALKMIQKARQVASIEQSQLLNQLETARETFEMASKAREYVQSQWVSDDVAWERDIDFLETAGDSCTTPHHRHLSHFHNNQEALAMINSASTSEREAKQLIDEIQARLELLEHNEHQLNVVSQELKAAKSKNGANHDHIWKSVNKTKDALNEIEKARQFLREEKGKFFHSQWDDRRIH